MSLLTPVFWLLLILPLIIIASINSKKINLKYLLFFVVCFLVDSYINALSHKYIDLSFLGLKFNWFGKIASLAFSLTIIFLVDKKNKEAIGFTTQTNKNTLKFGVLAFLGFLLFDFIFKMILFPKGGVFDLETFLFQLTMPGLAEELLYRGIYFWLLQKAFLPKWNFKGISFGWGFVIVTVLFGVCHGAILDENLQPHFDIVTIIYLILISSLSLGLLRKFSGNIIYPILGHNTINIMNAIIRLL